MMRTVATEDAKAAIVEKMEEGDAFLTLDWAMKVLPNKSMFVPTSEKKTTE